MCQGLLTAHFGYKDCAFNMMSISLAELADTKLHNAARTPKKAVGNIMLDLTCEWKTVGSYEKGWN